ncbi:Retrotransposable element Tf2 type 1 [Labeo rohita]|uniref:Retrotransposable element Tf2 type 1 n=1 Tax=Labeo rohita TaxID=84645 RepID=A0A498ML63_LABRO|nr:Retrotransposable element Tf2 type 1 [Labeo rohita]
MDTAEEDEMQRALMQQGALLGRQQEEIAASRHAYTEISLEINQLTERFEPAIRTVSAASSDAPSPRHDFFEDEPMQVGRARLTARERRRRLENQLCLYCGEPSDMVAACPVAWQHLPSKGGQKEEPVNLASVPEAYHDLRAFFKMSPHLEDHQRSPYSDWR